MSHYQIIKDLLTRSGVGFDTYQHPPCQTSEESRQARRVAGAGDTTGAKALLVKRKRGGFATMVLPGTARLNSRLARAAIGGHSFATPDQLSDVTAGLRPGTMPPFGPQLFPQIESLIIDVGVVDNHKIGFNAGEATRSIVMNGRDYLTVVKDNCVLASIV